MTKIHTILIHIGIKFAFKLRIHQILSQLSHQSISVHHL